MDSLSGRLTGKIDDFLAQIVSQDTPRNAQLQIEAKLVLPQDNVGASRRVVLDSIDIDNLRHQAISHIGSPVATPSGRPISGPVSHGMATEMDFSHPTATPFTQANYQPGFVPHVLTPRNYLCSQPVLPAGPGQPLISTQLHQTPPITPPVHSSGELPDRSSRRPSLQNDRTGRADPVAIDRLIEGIWEQIHSPKSLALGDDLIQTMKWVLEKMSGSSGRCTSTNIEFSNATKCCRQITTSSRTARVFEVMIQAHWIDCFDARLAALREDRAALRLQEHKKIVFTEACTSFSWSEKELRNRMSIWKGYREIKNAAGWTALIFAGPGIYRFCKYRMGFDDDAMHKLRALRLRAEVAADTLQPQWRQLLSLVGEPTEIQWTGHPHDWTVSLNPDQRPVPLAQTYRKWDPDFTFSHLVDSIIDQDQFGDYDPRRLELGPVFYCKSCSQQQSSLREENACTCFPDLYGPNPSTPAPVQIFQTENGKNNGLIALCAIEQGHAVGEFVGLITKGLVGVDVMQSQAGDNEPYQIWQGRCGNFTRFINHSCAPNCQFQTFSWLGVQRIVVVSTGVPAGTELTVDYSNQYWDNLDKICLCGERCCRYKDRRPRTAVRPFTGVQPESS